MPYTVLLLEEFVSWLDAQEEDRRRHLEKQRKADEEATRKEKEK